MKELASHAYKMSADYESNLEDIKESPVFSERLRLELIAIREASGLNLENFAHAIGVKSKQHVWGIEQGAAPSMEYLDKVDRAFGLWE